MAALATARSAPPMPAPIASGRRNSSARIASSRLMARKPTTTPARSATVTSQLCSISTSTRARRSAGDGMRAGPTVGRPALSCQIAAMASRSLSTADRRTRPAVMSHSCRALAVGLAGIADRYRPEVSRLGRDGALIGGFAVRVLDTVEAVGATDRLHRHGFGLAGLRVQRTGIEPERKRVVVLAAAGDLHSLAAGTGLSPESRET